MAKVLFVICVPAEENTKQAKEKSNHAKDVDSKGDKVDAELRQQLKDNDSSGCWSFPKKSSPVMSEAGKKDVQTADSGSDVSDIDLRSGGHADKDKFIEIKEERNSVVEASGKKTAKADAENALLRANSGSLNVLSTINEIDEAGSKNTGSNNKKKEGANENKSEGEDNRNGDDQNYDITEGDEVIGKKTDKQKDIPQTKEKGSSFDDDLETNFISFVSDGFTLLERVKAVLDLLDIPTVNWSSTEDNTFVGMFIAGDGQRCEEILDKLTYLDIGIIPGSSISVFPASISIAKDDQAEKLKLALEKKDELAEKVSEFKKSIKSRLVVAQVVDSVKSDAMFTFDYLMLIILASMVAIMGLLEASSVSLVASMLISPLMGPIIAFVFGAVIRNMELLKIGVTSEMRGLALCILVGFLSGFIPAGLESAGLQWRATENWPTSEMAARGAIRSLPVGVLIALPSGAGVALSILGGNVGSLVGVAISASLLPPAVNAGLLWANAIVMGILPPRTVGINKDSSLNSSVLTDSGPLYEADLTCPTFFNNDYIPIYSCNMAVESVILGVISLLLTLVNIVCIFFMGVAILKVKEVAPTRFAPDSEKNFFARDLKVARESYETTKGPNSAILGKKFLQEYKKFKEEIGVEDNINTDDELNEILEDVEEGEDVKEILDKLPHRPKRWSSFVEIKEDMMGNPYHTFHGGSSRPSSPNISLGFRKRASAAAAPFTPARIDYEERRSSEYLTIHRYVPPVDVCHSPRISHRSPGRFFSKKMKGRFDVAKVEEDNHNVPSVPDAPSSLPKMDIMPAIKEQESMPLLNMKPKEI